MSSLHLVSLLAEFVLTDTAVTIQIVGQKSAGRDRQM